MSVAFLVAYHEDKQIDLLRDRIMDLEKRNVRIIRYPAIAERDEAFGDKGEPLFEELKSLDFLLDRKRMMTQASWESEYQQNPIIAGVLSIARTSPLLCDCRLDHG